MDLKALQLTLRRFASELVQFADQSSIVLDETPGARIYVFVDWENVQPNEQDVRSLVPEVTDVWLFHGPNQKNVTSHHASFGDRATAVRIARTGKNALDFHLSFYMGYIASRRPDARFIVISNDKGYGPMLDHAGELGFAAEQIGFGAKAKTPAKKAATKSAATAAVVPAKRKATKKVAKPSSAKKAPAKKAATKNVASKPAVAKKVATAAPASAARSAPTGKSFEEVLAILKKSPPASRPRKYARLLTHIASMLGVDAGDPQAEAMAFRLLASGKVTFDENDSVEYKF